MVICWLEWTRDVKEQTYSSPAVWQNQTWHWQVATNQAYKKGTGVGWVQQKWQSHNRGGGNNYSPPMLTNRAFRCSLIFILFYGRSLTAQRRCTWYGRSNLPNLPMQVRGSQEGRYKSTGQYKIVLWEGRVGAWSVQPNARGKDKCSSLLIRLLQLILVMEHRLRWMFKGEVSVSLDSSS
jgi:hypothetical protein